MRWGEWRMARSKLLVMIAVGGGLALLAVVGLLFAVDSWQSGSTQRNEDRLGLGGTDVTERDLSPDLQVRLINSYAPIPVPSEATDIRLHYQRFQDIFLDASFSLPPAQYDDYVRQLTPLPPTVGVAPGTAYRGVTVGSYTSVVVPNPATRRITISYIAG